MSGREMESIMKITLLQQQQQIFNLADVISVDKQLQ